MEKALRLTVNDLINRGYQLGKEGNHLEAFAYFDRALELNPYSSDAWRGLGMCSQEVGDFKGALTSYKQALIIDSDSAMTWYHLGLLHAKDKNPEKALEYFEKAISLKSDFAEAWHNLGLAQGELGLPEAQYSLLRASELNSLQSKS